MIDPRPIAARIADQVPQFGPRVTASLDVADMIERPVAMPTCYVCPTGTGGGEPGRVTGMMQRRRHTVVVLVGLSARNSEGAAGAVIELFDLVTAVDAALSGWRAGTWRSALHYERDSLVATPKGGVWWEIVFTVQFP